MKLVHIHVDILPTSQTCILLIGKSKVPVNESSDSDSSSSSSEEEKKMDVVSPLAPLG